MIICTTPALESVGDRAVGEGLPAGGTIKLSPFDRINFEAPIWISDILLLYHLVFHEDSTFEKHLLETKALDNIHLTMPLTCTYLPLIFGIH